MGEMLGSQVAGMGTARVRVRVTIKTPRSRSQADKLKGRPNESRGQAKASTVLNTSDTAVMGNSNDTGAMLEMWDTVQLGALQTGRTHRAGTRTCQTLAMAQPI